MWLVIISEFGSNTRNFVHNWWDTYHNLEFSDCWTIKMKIWSILGYDFWHNVLEAIANTSNGTKQWWKFKKIFISTKRCIFCAFFRLFYSRLTDDLGYKIFFFYFFLKYVFWNFLFWEEVKNRNREGKFYTSMYCLLKYVWQKHDVYEFIFQFMKKIINFNFRISI